ncbi:hypothetical protein [Polluticoccus soli]|uniref:hypothetical protein n=1 Tax=Polluticoccus soli TaxID=3034150 RepID=UPI0023E1D79D|nr:hypothetical protein [Flavipsychrobacter sp. JY13-12]
MVKITGYALRERKDGTPFVTLQLTGGVELVQSQATGNFYATVRKCNIPATFPEDVAKMMIGQQLDGEIVRVQVDPYEYLNQRTGEVMMLTHSYAYRPKGAIELIGHTPVMETVH